MAEIKLEVGNNYYKNGKEVVIVKMGKIILDGREYEAVVYDNIGKQYDNIVIEKKSDFMADIVPICLNIGDRIIAVCMGKILATYSVVSLGKNTDAVETVEGVDDGGERATFSMKTKPNGLVENFYKPINLPQQAEFFYVSSKLENKLAVSKIINKCLSNIENIREKLSSYSIDYLNIDLNKLQILSKTFEGVKEDTDKIIKII